MRRAGLLRLIALLLLAHLLLANPAAAQTPTPTLDNLSAALKAAPNEVAASAIEAQIREAWAAAASPAVRLLLARGRREMEAHAFGDALDSFDAALDLEPELLAAWRGRAAARSALGDYAGSVRDIREVLRRAPDSFLAYSDLSRMAEAHGDWKAALVAWEKLLEVDPQAPGGQARLQDLRRRALGEQL